MKKHVLILCLLGNPYQKADGGFHKTVYEIIEHFKETDILITIITSNPTLSEDIFCQKYSNINFFEFALEQEWIENQDQLYINSNYLTEKILKIIAQSTLEISLIHSLHWINGYLATKINPQKKIVHIHSIISSSFERKTKGFSLRSQYQPKCEDVAFNAANILISITEAEKKQLVDYYHISPLKIIIMGRTADFYYSYFSDIYHSQISKTDKLEYNTLSINDNNSGRQKSFIYIGRIIEYKGIKEIIKAWHMVYMKYKDETPPLWLIGGVEKTIYQFRNIIIKEFPFLIECEKMHKIYWWGYMESYGISTLLQKSHVLLMHSAFEPGGRVLLEAMSASKPIIATPEGFAQTYIKDWYNGFQVKYQDVKQLAIYMEFFVINEYLSSMMGINAKNTYSLLKNEWKYYERLENLYHSSEIILENIVSFEFTPQNLHPFLIDEFPYCDIKNNDADLLCLTEGTDIVIKEITNHKSYIWKISSKCKIFFVKQVYNQLNLNQLWNPFDSQKIYTIWMQYYTATFSAKFSCIVSPSITSEKLFTYVLPWYDILPDEQILKIYPVLLRRLAKYEYGVYEITTLYKEQINFFKKLNGAFQYKHKYYTINTYVYELQKTFEKNKNLFQTNDILPILQFFQEINHFCSLRKQIEYGLNYGKYFFGHVLNQNYLLLPSSDIFIGELGQDEGFIFTIYYLKNHTFLDNLFYPRKQVLIWSLLHCIELFISSKILYKPSPVTISDLKKIFDMLNSEK